MTLFRCSCRKTFQTKEALHHHIIDKHSGMARVTVRKPRTVTLILNGRRHTKLAENPEQGN